MRTPYLKDIRNIVIKVGTSVLTTNGRFDKRAVNNLAAQVAGFLRKGVRVSVVSSGAIGAGMTLLGLGRRPAAMEALQAAAAVGQRYLMQCYEEAFSRHGYSTAQMLLTWDDLAERKRFMNAKRTLKKIQKWGVVPVINENDTVATEEIRFGDNDRLSSLLSILVEADAQVILSDTDGLYARGGKNRIRIVEKLGPAIFSHVSDRKGAFTIGGMRSKLEAVRMSVSSGIPVFLADGRVRAVLPRLFRGEDLGTFFPPDLKKRRLKNQWIIHFMSHVQNKEKGGGR